MGRRLYLRYSDTTSPASGHGAIGSVYQAHYFDQAFFRDVDHETVIIDHEMLDRSVKQDNLGYRMRMEVKLSPNEIETDRNFLQSFLTAKHKWALTVFTESGKEYLLNFHNTDDAPDGWVKCRIDGNEHGTSVEQLMNDGFTLISEKIYTVPEVPVNVSGQVADGNTVTVRWGADDPDYADWWDRLSKCVNPIYEVYSAPSPSFNVFTLQGTTLNRTLTTGVLANRTYKFKVTAKNGYGSSSSGLTGELSINT